jgi:DNA (cytosine-5)-methyltransferase 1
MKFIDLFAGLGGFHLALKRLGHECVFASEIDESLRNTYHKNFDIMPAGDIRLISENDIPLHDILCAGFPCQPFSKAGGQQGFADPKWGDLFSHVIRIVHSHKPRYVILENVPNLEKHNNGITWQRISNELMEEGYEVKSKRLSPHKFGIPQIRDRIFIVGSLCGLSEFRWPEEMPSANLSVLPILDHNPIGSRRITTQVEKCLETWQSFISQIPPNEEILSPIWSMEFGATYPYENRTPFASGFENLKDYLGNHGKSLEGLSVEETIRSLPSYARVAEKKFPDWKIKFIGDSRQLYEKHKNWIDKWLPEILEFPPSLQKMEWNCKGGERNIWKYIIQFRASGVRIKRPTTSPSLVAMTTTQVPIIAWEKRYMTPQECTRLQSMGELSYLPESSTKTYKALGNAVNADVVELICKALFYYAKEPGLIELEKGYNDARLSHLPLFLEPDRIDLP